MCSCTGLFEYSPFDTDVKSQNLNQKNILLIDRQAIRPDTLKFAVFSDVHENYDDMADAIRSLNARDDISFVICNGDITNQGLADEFMWFADVASLSAHPFLTVIGNHDHLAHGKLVFERIFGPVNMSFTAGDYKFLLFSNIVWENDNNSPDYEWLRDELAAGDRNIIVAHQTPEAEDIGPLHRIIYKEIADSANTMLTLYASAHHFDDKYYNGIRMFVSDAIVEREYYLFTLTGRDTSIERIKF